MAFPADLMRIMDQFGHCASPYRASFQIVLKIDVCNLLFKENMISMIINYLENQSQLVPQSLLPHPRREQELSLKKAVQHISHRKTNIFFPLNVPDPPLELVSMVPPP